MLYLTSMFRYAFYKSTTLIEIWNRIQDFETIDINDLMLDGVRALPIYRKKQVQQQNKNYWFIQVIIVHSFLSFP